MAVFARRAEISTQNPKPNPRDQWPAWTDQVIKLGADGEPIGPTSTQSRSDRKGGRS